MGVYRPEEVDSVSNHKGEKYILWMGNDCNPNYNTRIKNMKKILITGGTGFIGSKISELLVKKNFNVKNDHTV